MTVFFVSFVSFVIFVFAVGSYSVTRNGRCHTFVIRLPFDRHTPFVSHQNRRLAIRDLSRSGSLPSKGRIR